MSRTNYNIEIVSGDIKLDRMNDNVDVIVEFDDGVCYSATFFTLSNIKKIMKRYSTSDECLAGTYFWCANMIVVRDMERSTIEAAVEDLVNTGEFFSLFDGPS